jgi:hypothetical protein
VRAPRPRLRNPLDARSRVFLALNRIQSQRIRDWMLLRQMDIG